MNGKKDPGKFTVRFNIADPQQREVVETLDKQGRYKAQFLTNAVLHYIHGGSVPDAQSASAANSKQIERIVRDILAQQAMSIEAPVPEALEPSNADFGANLDSADKSAILKTMQSFRQQ